MIITSLRVRDNCVLTADNSWSSLENVKQLYQTGFTPAAVNYSQKMVQTTKYITKKTWQVKAKKIDCGCGFYLVATMMYVSETCWWQTQPFLLFSLCWPSIGSSNFSSLRIQFSAEKWNLIKHVLSYQLMLKYHMFWTQWNVPVQCCIVFKVGKITVVGHVCFMIILSVKLRFMVTMYI